MKRVLYVVVLACVVLAQPFVALAAPTNHIVISEVQTASLNNASEEFIELYNPTAGTLSLANWTIEYSSTAGTSWTKKATLVGTIAPLSFYLVSTAGYLSADSTMTAGLAGTGGHVRLKDATGSVVDLVGWGSAAHAETLPADAPAAGGSLERLPGRLNELAGNGEDTNNNLADFIGRETAQPQNTLATTEDPNALPPEPEPEPEPTSADEPVVAPSYLTVAITELFPDPGSPLTDSKDEFIELFNHNSEAINLKGYVLRTGSAFKSYYTIGDVIIPSGGYKAFYSVTTGLGLTNSGGAVQVLDPLGNILDVSDAYSQAKTGQAWADIDGVWNWTLEPTGGAANVLSIAPLKTTATVTKKATTTKKKATAKKATTKKKATSKTKTAKAVKAPKVGIAAATEAIANPSPIARWLLIAAGCFTIVYAIYGFRHDLYQYYTRSKRYATARLSAGRSLSWWRNLRAR